MFAPLSTCAFMYVLDRKAQTLKLMQNTHARHHLARRHVGRSQAKKRHQTGREVIKCAMRR